MWTKKPTVQRRLDTRDILIPCATDAGDHLGEVATPAKAYTSVRPRDTPARCREVFGGNGIDLDYSIGRFFADQEAVYTYEGICRMNTLIVGWDSNGPSALV